MLAEALGHVDGLGGLLYRHHGILAHIVVSRGLELIGLGPEAPQRRIGSNVVLRQPEEFGVDAMVRLCCLVGSLEDEGLSGMKSNEVGGSGRILVQADL